ncbi:MAG: four helix bundle protein [Opitutales bacterium]|nr:four helix bundle protein [Opitutales bacterium]
MSGERRNKNRGYQKLIVWQDAVAYLAETRKLMRNQVISFEERKLISQQFASVDSIHRNIAEGYCRRSIREYIHFLYTALASAGESVSAQIAYHRSGLINDETFEELDSLSFKIENEMLRLIESLQRKQADGSWDDSFIVEESNSLYNQVTRPSA